VTISSLGNTITKAVSVAEMVRHRVPHLHQDNQISTQVLQSQKDDGERKVTALRIVLSLEEPAVKGIGY
jgi:DNA-binding protein